MTDPGTRSSERHRRRDPATRIAEAREDARLVEGLTLEQRVAMLEDAIELAWAFFEANPNRESALRQRDPVPVDLLEKLRRARERAA